MHKNRIRTKWESLDGRRVRLPVVLPARRYRQALALPILLLHGLAGSGAVWRRALPLFAARGLPVPLYAPNLPGFGQSQGPPQALGMEDLAAGTVRFLDTVGIARAHIAGNSIDCQVALALAEA